VCRRHKSERVSLLGIFQLLLGGVDPLSQTPLHIRLFFATLCSTYMMRIAM
jgi:hypothetical protein